MKLSRKEKNSYWMPYTDNEWFKKNPKLLDSAKGMYYKTYSGEKILDAVAGLWCVNAGHCREKNSKGCSGSSAKNGLWIIFSDGTQIIF